MQRRSVVAAAVAGAVPLFLPREVLGLGRRMQPVGLQLYTVRGLMEKDFEGTLAAVAKVGYREVEFAGYFGRTPAQVKAALGRAGLVAPSAHVPVSSLRDEWPATLDAAAEIGHRYLVVPSVPAGMRKVLADWQAIAERFNRAGEAAQKQGIQFAYHNHEYEFVAEGGKLPYDALLQATDVELVQFEMDLYWIRKGGQNPFTYFVRWPGRFPLVHVKDMAKDGAMVDVGAGVIDWKAIYGVRKQAGIKHWFVEHDEPADPMKSLATSYAYMRGLK